MLFFVGGLFILLGIIRIIGILVGSARPKTEVQIKDFTFSKLKTDLFGLGGNQKHAKVAFVANGQPYETDVFVGKNFHTPIGGNMIISYKSTDPKVAKYHNPKMEWLVVAMFFIFGIVICVVSLLLSSVLTSLFK